MTRRFIPLLIISPAVGVFTIPLLKFRNKLLWCGENTDHRSRGSDIAIKATARKLAELYYKIFSEGMQYVEKGVKIYQEQIERQQLAFLNKKAQELNLKLVVNE